ncbi:MAG: hypothetical protein KA007_00160 [Candidatus Pacebacteria bacterium]|jgi:hypothetical protein|nr:hypothetical protein [Candidatus Paceibacterota bacterium]
MEKNSFDKWYRENKESLRDEYRMIKASMKLDCVVDIPTLKQWAKDRYDFSINH